MVKKGESAPTFIEQGGDVVAAQTGPNAPNFNRIDKVSNRRELEEMHSEFGNSALVGAVDPARRWIDEAKAKVAPKPGEVRKTRTPAQSARMDRERDRVIHRATLLPRGRRNDLRR